MFTPVNILNFENPINKKKQGKFKLLIKMNTIINQVLYLNSDIKYNDILKVILY